MPLGVVFPFPIFSSWMTWFCSIKMMKRIVITLGMSWKPFTGYLAKKSAKVNQDPTFVPTFPYRREWNSDILEFKSTPNLGNYLGFPLKFPSSMSQDFNFVFENVQKKLSNLKRHMLSFVGTVILTKSVMSSVPSYVILGVVPLGRILNSLDKISRNFIWGSIDDKWILHLVG